jgi:predicted nucleic acid-binding protein
VVTSSLARVEVSRRLRALVGAGRLTEDRVADGITLALSRVAESVITDDMMNLAELVAPTVLRTLDAIHLAAAILLEVDVVVTYDRRLAEACRHNGLAVVSPSP